MALSKAQRERVAQGWQLHQQGKLLDAEKIYEVVRRQAPSDAELLNLLGAVAIATGRPAQARDFFAASVRADPREARAHNNLGNALRDLGELEAALLSYDYALDLDPGLIEGYTNRAIVALQRSMFGQALADCDIALGLRPNYPEAWLNHGSALQGLGRLDAALESFGRAIALRPGYAPAHEARGTLLQALGRFGEAVASLRRARALDPTLAQAQLQLGIALRKLDRLDDAELQLDQAIAREPGSATAHAERGYLMIAQARYDQAADSLTHAIALRPDDGEAQNGLGIAMSRTERHDAALTYYDRAVALMPGKPNFIHNRGVALLNLDRAAEALGCFDQTLTLEPDDPVAHNSRGRALWVLDHRGEALASIAHALERDPELVDAHWNLALLSLQLGDLPTGFAHYEWRSKLPIPTGKRNFAAPQWLGEPDIAGRRIFVYWEQGLGDTLQLHRYLPLLVARGAEIVFAVQDELRGLLTPFLPGIELIGPNEMPSVFDLHSPLLSLPLAFGTTLATIPPPLGLHEPPAIRAKFASMLGGKRRRPRVGIAWSGSQFLRRLRNRSIPLAAWQGLLAMEADWVVLQKDILPEDIATLSAFPQLRYFPDAIQDFADTAALIADVDLVITIDTSVAHLAGAMGKPVWILLRYDPDWRWMLERNDSPWYPSARLFRQTIATDWDGVLTDVGQALVTTLAEQAANQPP